MPRLNDLPKGESVIGLIYGPAGSGKTDLLGTAGNEALIINIGMGIATLQSQSWKKRNPNCNPIIETILEDAIPNTAEAFDKVCDIIDEYLEKYRSEIKYLIIDDATALRRFAMNKGLEINQKLGKSNSLSRSKQDDYVAIAVQDYGIEMDLIDKFIIGYTSICRDMGLHFFMSAHERVQYNAPRTIGETPTINSVKPGFTGRTFPDSVTGHFDLVFYTEVKGSGDRAHYQVRTVGDSSLVAKCRFGGIFKNVEEIRSDVSPSGLTLPKIIERIKNG